MNPKCFQAIVDYLNDMKMSSNDSAPDPPSVMDEYANILLSQCKLFGVPNSAIEGIGISNSAIEGSNILNETYCKTLHGWLREDGSDGKFELLYQSSRDGISANNFHSKCDDCAQCTFSQNMKTNIHNFPTLKRCEQMKNIYVGAPYY